MKQAESDKPTVTESTIVPGVYHVVMGDFEDVCTEANLPKAIQEVEDAYYEAVIECIDGQDEAVREIGIKLIEEGFAQAILPQSLIGMQLRKRRNRK